MSSLHDITIPPTLPERTSPWTPNGGGRNDHVTALAENLNGAWLHGMVTTAISVMLTFWTIKRGMVPALDPAVGVPMLILHLGAWITGWFAFESALEAWRHVQFLPDRKGIPARVVAIASAAVASLLVNTAMVVSAILP